MREIIQLTEKIKHKSGDVQCTSWRYPLINSDEVEVCKLLVETAAADRYTFVLELTCDRIVYVLYLLIKFLEMSESLRHFRPQRNVKRPSNLTMAALLNMVWDRLESVVDVPGEDPRVPAKEVTVGDGPKASRHSQTNVCSLTSCSSCSMVQDFVTQMVFQVGKFFEDSEDSEVLKER